MNDHPVPLFGPRPCLFCGKVIVPKRNNAQKYCNDVCSRKALRARQRAERGGYPIPTAHSIEGASPDHDLLVDSLPPAYAPGFFDSLFDPEDGQ